MDGAVPQRFEIQDLAAIADAASREAGGVPVGLLGDYLSAVVGAAASGRRLTAGELAGYGQSGERAALAGVALRGLVDLYLSATWRLWREFPAGVPKAAGLAVLRAADDAVAAAAEGFERARLGVARREEAERREFLDDLLLARGRVGDLIIRGDRLGLRLAGPHQVVVAGAAAGSLAFPASLETEAVIASAAAPSPALVATRSGQLVAVVGAADGGEADRVARALARALAPPGQAAGHPLSENAGQQPGLPAGQQRQAGQQPRWRIMVGRSYPGPRGVARSYEEASEALEVAHRLGLADLVATAADLLIYQVLVRDRAAIADLVHTVLPPLARARGGAAPLMATLSAYFARGGVAAAAARDLHLSVRAVTYRLARVKQLTGRDPAVPADALILQVAVIGARLLDWPASPLAAR
jgi:sugar diacid utilization regulator